ncbi:unnamed protein product [Euphydryas editha]|uniref:Craniofacial development protein 2-like n=1 Tax=Euphydryas editha TaxID=104508 RepID=A0AAU9V2A1_EUPED|nr:unnamed protein product [Euphydryas editha]
MKWQLLDTITLKSSNLYFREVHHLSQGGIGFLVNKALAGNVVEISSVSTDRVTYLVLNLTKRYSLKVIQVYALTSLHSDEEVETMYENIATALHSSAKAHYSVVMGEFNVRVGVYKLALNMVMESEITEAEYLLISWRARGFSWFNAGSDHRLIRGSLNKDLKLERSGVVRSTPRPTLFQANARTDTFQLQLDNRFDALAPTLDIDEDFEHLEGLGQQILSEQASKVFLSHLRSHLTK